MTIPTKESVLHAILHFVVTLALIATVIPSTAFVLELLTIVLSVRNHIISILWFACCAMIVVYAYVTLLVVLPFSPFRTQAWEMQLMVFSAVNLAAVPRALVMPPAEGQILARLAVSIFIFFLAATSNLR